MKEKTKKRLMVFFLVLLIIAAFFFINNQIKIKKQNQPNLVLSNLNKNKISQINIEDIEQKTTLIKKNGRWLVTKNNIEFLADEERINQILDKLFLLNKNNLVSTNKNRHKELGIDKRKISLVSHDKKYDIYIGNISGMSNNYFRYGQDDQVFLGEALNDIFYPDDYRDLNLHLIGDENKITSIEISYLDTAFSLVKKESKGSTSWLINNKKAKRETVDFYLNDLKTLKANDILPTETNLPEAGEIRINILENGQQKKIEFFPQDEENYLVKTSSSKNIYQVSASSITSLKKEEKDFIE